MNETVRSDDERRAGVPDVPPDDHEKEDSRNRNNSKKKKEIFFQTAVSASPTANHSLDPPSSHAQTVEKRIRRIEKYKWIHDLHEVGIRKIHIVYREFKIGDADPLPLSPTLVVCELEIRDPATVEIKSDPMPTKVKARDDAISKLLSELVLKKVPSNNNNNNGPDVKSEPSDMVGTTRSLYDELEEKEKLLLCDPPYIHFEYQLPCWARWNVAQHASGLAVLLYEVIVTSQHSMVVCERLGIPSDQVTRLGLLLPDCKDFWVANSPNNHAREFEASFRFRNSGKEYTARLVTPQRITLEDGRPTRQLLEDFYVICTQWKMYGKNCPLQALKRNCETDKGAKTGRHYTFVPLVQGPGNEIDWELIDRVVANQTSPYLVAKRLYGFLVFCASTTVLFLIWAVFCIRRDLSDSAHGGLEVVNIIPWNVVIFYTILVSLGKLLYPSWAYQSQDARNRFLHYTKPKNTVFISQVPEEAASKWMELRKARPVLSAYQANKISDYSLEADPSKNRAKPMFLLPEHIRVLPVPRDFLFAVGAAEYFMLSIEIAITNHSMGQHLKRVASSIGSKVLSSETHDTAGVKGVDHSNIFVDLLAEATTVFPTSRFERLEFLGDRVLNNMISLNLFSRNGRLDWGHDELNDHLSRAKKNLTLVDGALRAGVNRLIRAGIIPWKEDHASFVIPDSFLCNVAESILGAAYLHDVGSCGTGKTVVGILERLRPPVPPDECTEMRFDDGWFRHHDVCWEQGYDFGLHPQWLELLHEANAAFHGIPSVSETMEIKSNKLLSLLLGKLPQGDRDAIQQKLRYGNPRTLLFIALFDAEMDGTDEALPDSSDQLERLHVVGMIRDNLFHIGSTSLELVMSRDLYLLNPNATPSDLHLLLACALTNDVLAYIFLKWGMHECCFDENPPYRDTVVQIAIAADKIGHRRWEGNGGWILPGGLATFRARQQHLLQLKPELAHERLDAPKYPGLAGGRLFGNDKKLNMTTIEDWQFSFKCIVGSLVLSLGTEATWYTIFRPLMEEVMLLTPNEYRFHFSNVSTVCKSYSQGNVNCLAKTSS